MRRFWYWLALSLIVNATGCAAKPGDRPVKIGFMPKLVGIPYFNACRRGAGEAAKELGVELVYNGPTQADANQQINLLNQWVASGEYAVVALACNDPDLVAPT